MLHRTVLFGCLLAVACGDDSTSGGGGAGAAGGGPSTGGSTSTDGGGPSTGGSGAGTSAGGEGTGAGPTGGAPPCTASTLEEAVRITDLPIDGASSARAWTAQAGSGSVVAWEGSDGSIHVQRLDAEDQPFGDDLLVDGDQLYGLAATPDDVALLVSRPPDFMTFVKIDTSGNQLAVTNLVGGGDHGVEGVEWFGEFAQTGRMVQRADGSYAAYHALHRRWPDGIGHQGDTLRLLTSGGAAAGGGWGWGCSHSMDQRLADGPNGLVPICIADCYPGKGIYFNHNQAQLTDDPGANCMGGYSTELGGLVADASGFFLVYQDDSGGAHLGAFSTTGQPVTERALSVPGSSRLARYDGGLLLGSGNTTLQRLDASLADLGGPASIGAPLPDGDFESRSDGEVAWASAAGGTLSVVRVRVCEP
jgi:hypothetical protein